MSEKINSKPLIAIKVNDKDQLDFVMDGTFEDIAKMIAEVCLQDERAMLVFKIATGNITLREASLISKYLQSTGLKPKGYDKN